MFCDSIVLYECFGTVSYRFCVVPYGCFGTFRYGIDRFGVVWYYMGVLIRYLYRMDALVRYRTVRVFWYGIVPYRCFGTVSYRYQTETIPIQNHVAVTVSTGSKNKFTGALVRFGTVSYRFGVLWYSMNILVRCCFTEYLFLVQPSCGV